MTAKEARIEVLKGKLRIAGTKGYATNGVCRKWRRELRHLGVIVGMNVE